MKVGDKLVFVRFFKLKFSDGEFVGVGYFIKLFRDVKEMVVEMDGKLNGLVV